MIGALYVLISCLVLFSLATSQVELMEEVFEPHADLHVRSIFGKRSLVPDLHLQAFKMSPYLLHFCDDGVRPFMLFVNGSAAKIHGAFAKGEHVTDAHSKGHYDIYCVGRAK